MKRALFPAGIFLAATLLFPRTAVAGDPLPPGRRYPSPDGNATAVLATLPFRAEVWLIEGGGPPRLALRADGETFSELAWQPGGQSFTVVRTPLGTETAAWGTLWRYHLPSGRALPVDEHYAARRLPHKTAPPLPRRATAGANLSPPDTIRVKHHPSNTCRSVPVGQIDAIPFEEYVKRVVPAEVFPSWPENTLKAQAVAARTYAWHQILIHQSWDFDVTDWVDYQAMCDLTTPATDAAVAATRGQYLAYNGQVILAMYSAENGSPTKTNPAAPYLQAVDDPVSFGQPRLGHGYGMGQWGAQRWAARHNWSYQAILRHYYSGVTVEQGAAPTGDAPPNVSLVAPWADHYRTGNKLRLVANTTDDGGVISYTAIYLAAPLTPTLLFSVTGPAPPQGFVLDVSGWADRSLLDGGLVFTALAVDGSGKRSVSPPLAIGLDRVAPTALLTTPTALTGSAVISGSLGWPVTVVAADATAGVTHLALGMLNWRWEGETFARETVGTAQVGQTVSDPAALNGRAVYASPAHDPPGSWAISTTLLPANRPYRAYFRLKVGDNASTAEVARLELFAGDDPDPAGLHRLRGVDFREAGMYQEFHADFDVHVSGSGTFGPPLTFKLTFNGVTGLTFDRLVVVEYPRAFDTMLPPGYQGNLRLKVIDGAGNVSPDLELWQVVLPRYPIYLPLVQRFSF